MKRVIILGATGSLAQYVIEALKESGNVKLTLFARNTSRLSKTSAEGCTIVKGDAINYNDVKNAVSGHDIVYINLAGNLELMAKNIVKAMSDTGVKRIIAISSIGIYTTPLKPVLIPYRKLADVIESSGLEYTILRPIGFPMPTKLIILLRIKHSQNRAQLFPGKVLPLLWLALSATPTCIKMKTLELANQVSHN
jgi:uncharacterized protein YbjT (DUF2867 family)